VLMGWQAQGQRPFYIRWQNSMSYINQALKKAQKDKDAGHISYIRSIGRSGSRSERVSGKRYLYATLAVIILASGGIYYIIMGNNVKTPKVAAAPAVTGQRPVLQKENRDIGVSEKANKDKENAIAKEAGRNGITDENKGLYKKAVLLLKEKRVREAEAVYMEILRGNPGHIASLNDIGALYLHEGKYSDAIIHLEKAIRLKPDFVNPCYNLACAYALNNEPEKGMAYLEKAVDIDKEVMAWAKNDPDLKNLRSQSGFMALIE
jgi:tetratricopeptide (TPR) repeat protein